MVGSPCARNEPDLRRIGIHPDFWYPLALSKDLKPNRAIPAAFAGEPIVLARTESGTIFALEDRCAHRQVPLSLGVVAGERLRCCYHAWSYDVSGRCVAVPYLATGTELPRGVRSYPCREAYGLIFVFAGDPQKARYVLFPEISRWANREYRTMYFSREVKCHYSFMHENLMDMNHQFLHRRIMGSVRVARLDVRRGHGSLEVDYRLDRIAGRRHWGVDLLVSRLRDAGGRGEDHDIIDHRDAISIPDAYRLPGRQPDGSIRSVGCVRPHRPGAESQPQLRPPDDSEAARSRPYLSYMVGDPAFCRSRLCGRSYGRGS